MNSARRQVGAILRQLPHQPGRLLAAGIYMTAFVAAAFALTGSLPPPNAAGLWFYVAAVNLVINRLVLEPFYTRPADAITAAAALAIAVVTLEYPVDAPVTRSQFDLAKAVFLAYSAAVLAISALAVFLKDYSATAAIARAAALIVRTAGRSAITYSLLFLAIVYLEFGKSAASVATLYFLWFVTSVRPVESIFQLLSSLAPSIDRPFGHVIAMLEPRTVDIEMAAGAIVRTGDRIWFPQLKTWAVVVDVSVMRSRPRCRVLLEEPRAVSVGDELYRLGEGEPSVIGRVGVASTVYELQVELAQDRSSAVSVGDLVGVQLDDSEVLYQVLGAEVRTDTGDNPREFIRAATGQVGSWDKEHRAFRSKQWVPAPGSQVFSYPQAEPARDDIAFGYVPNTAFPLVLSTEAAVPMNTAILGVIGSGKTHAAWELIRRAILSDTKVIALDITGRYSREFADILDPDAENGISEVIDAATKGNLTNRQVQHGEAGNVLEFRRRVRDFVDDYIDSPYRLIVINPAEFRVTRLDGFARDGVAQALAELTPAEVTRHVAEMTLQVMQRRDRTGRRRLLTWLVLEEAHSLVPEINSTAVAAEQRAATATSRSILQGRKFGLGCLVVTQRTANVSKTLLTQCNTVIALRTMDATGVEYVGTMIGASPAQVLPGLPQRQALVFGVASSCPTPLVVRLNDYPEFCQDWRKRGRVPYARWE